MPELTLRDIHLPESTTGWPLGYWLLAAFTILIIICLIFLLWKVLKPTLRKKAFNELKRIETFYKKTGDASQCLSAASQLLRQVTICKHPNAAGITGKAWLELLDQSLGNSSFSQGAGQILLKGPYQRNVENDDVLKLINLCQSWVKGL